MSTQLTPAQQQACHDLAVSSQNASNASYVVGGAGVIAAFVPGGQVAAPGLILSGLVIQGVSQIGQTIYAHMCQ
jgi:hypothetical protein